MDFDSDIYLANLWGKVSPNHREFPQGRKNEDYLLHDIVSDLQQHMDEAKKYKDSRQLAGRVKEISTERLQKYASWPGQIEKFFSSLRNLVTLGTFTSSGQLGVDLANELIEATLTPQEKANLKQTAQSNLKKVNLQLKDTRQKEVLKQFIDTFSQLDLRKWEPSSSDKDIYTAQISKTKHLIIAGVPGKIVIPPEFQVKMTRNSNETVISFPNHDLYYEFGPMQMALYEVRMEDGENEVTLKASGLEKKVSYDEIESFLSQII